jgi:hypothetical protein
MLGTRAHGGAFVAALLPHTANCLIVLSRLTMLRTRHGYNSCPWLLLQTLKKEIASRRALSSALVLALLMSTAAFADPVGRYAVLRCGF